MKYTKIVNQIKGLHWELLDKGDIVRLMILSHYAAEEFAESLRIALRLHPGNLGLREMAVGELRTTNLRFGTYCAKGDHSDFLRHFIVAHDLLTWTGEATKQAGREYRAKVSELPREVRAMSVVSRERELPGIFGRILEAKDWSGGVLPAFRYYIEEHIRLDSMEGGHADLLSDFVVTDEVTQFYEARLDLYRCIPALFA
jgi:hypothetical protein